MGSSVLVVEIPVVAASVARSRDGAVALAALGISIAVIVVLNTPALAMAPLVISEAGRRAQRQLRRYAFGVGAAGCLATFVLAGIPALFGALRWLMNLDHALAGDLRVCLLALAPASVAVAARRYLHGRLIFAERTRPITAATLVRIGCSGTLAWVWVLTSPATGAFGGGLALTCGAGAEFTVLALAVRRIAALPAAGPGHRSALLRRHGQLSSSLLLNMVPTLITTVGITHSRLPARSLVAWPALIGLLSLFTVPAMDWESVTAAALRRDRADRAPGQLTGWLAAGLLGLFGAVLLSPAGEAYMRGFIDVPRLPAQLGLAWAPVLLAAPPLWAIRSYARGIVVADGSTQWLVHASVAHVIALTALSASLSFSALPGVACGSLAIVGGLVADTVVTWAGASRFRPRPAAESSAELTAAPAP